MTPQRSLPRVFVPGASADAPIPLSDSEWDKLRKVLRMGVGDPLAVLPDDGTLIRCTLAHKSAQPESVEALATEPARRIVLAQALPKGDRLDDLVRGCTEVGVSGFVLFPADRSVVKWDAAKFRQKVARLEAIVRESAEQSYRALLPKLATADSLKEVLDRYPDAVVLSEVEGVGRGVRQSLSGREEAVLVVGPEGGWSPREVAAIGERAATMGPRVLRVDTAAVAACALALLDEGP